MKDKRWGRPDRRKKSPRAGPHNEPDQVLESYEDADHLQQDRVGWRELTTWERIRYQQERTRRPDGTETLSRQVEIERATAEAEPTPRPTEPSALPSKDDRLRLNLVRTVGKIGLVCTVLFIVMRQLEQVLPMLKSHPVVAVIIAAALVILLMALIGRR